MATYRVRRSLATDRDLALIADFLFEAYVGFGKHPEDAFARRKARLETIEELMLAFAEQPHRAIPRDDVLPGRRMLTRGRVLLGFDTPRPTAKFASSARSWVVAIIAARCLPGSDGRRGRRKACAARHHRGRPLGGNHRPDRQAPGSLRTVRRPFGIRGTWGRTSRPRSAPAGPHGRRLPAGLSTRRAR